MIEYVENFRRQFVQLYYSPSLTNSLTHSIPASLPPIHPFTHTAVSYFPSPFIPMPRCAKGKDALLTRLPRQVS